MLPSAFLKQSGYTSQDRFLGNFSIFPSWKAYFCLLESFFTPERPTPVCLKDSLPLHCNADSFCIRECKPFSLFPPTHSSNPQRRIPQGFPMLPALQVSWPSTHQEHSYCYVLYSHALQSIYLDVFAIWYEKAQSEWSKLKGTQAHTSTHFRNFCLLDTNVLPCCIM